LNEENRLAVSQGILFSVEPEHFIPPFPTKTKYCIIPYAVVEPQNMVDTDSGVGFDVATKRKYTACFGGRNQTLIRADILRAMSTQENGTRILGNQEHQQYMKDLLDCDFCFIPDGDVKSTGRLFEALVAGCIPLVKSPLLELPYTRLLDWSKISLTYAEDFPASSILHTIDAYSLHDIHSFRTKIASIKPSHMFGFRNPLVYAPHESDWNLRRSLGDYVWRECLSEATVDFEKKLLS
ncbi:glycosyltransferase family 47 protein, partial [bacterium]|nr:glycosyltransferase family 47 protein [bacterium]